MVCSAWRQLNISKEMSDLVWSRIENFPGSAVNDIVNRLVVIWWANRQTDRQTDRQTCMILEMSQGRAPHWAISTMRWRVLSGSGRPLTNVPPSWFTPLCPVIHIRWQWRNSVPYLCQLTFVAILWVKLRETFLTVVALKYALLAIQWSYVHFC